MKTIRLSTAAFVLGSLAASIAACSAQSTSEPPRGSAGSTSTGNTGNVGTGNTGNVGTGNTGNVGTGNTGNVGTGNTGNVGAGGTTPIGTAGTTSTGTAGTTSTGTAGSGSGMSCGTLQPNASDPKCCVAAGTATDLAIDDLEDDDNTILPIGNRQGYWYSYKDASAATTLMQSAMPFPPAMTGHACSLMPVPPACAGMAGGTKGSAEISGMVNLATMTAPAYAGMGFDFNNHFMKSCAYNASAYKGITFYAKGSAFKVSIKIPATTGTGPLSAGTCAAMCEDHYSQSVGANPDWTQVTVTFADSTRFKQAGWGTVATFDPANILGVQFQVDGLTTQTAPVAYDFSVDDLTFF